jgi:hypothetical protein
LVDVGGAVGWWDVGGGGLWLGLGRGLGEGLGGEGAGCAGRRSGFFGLGDPVCEGGAGSAAGIALVFTERSVGTEDRRGLRGWRRRRAHGLPSFPRTTPLGNFFGGCAVAVSELAEAVDGSRVSSAICYLTEVS